MKVYATCFWEEDIKLYENLKKFGFGKAEWKDIQFVTDGPFDFAIILTAPHKHCREFSLKDSVTFLTEPPISGHHPKERGVVCPMYLPCPWWINRANNKTDNQFKSKISKQNLLSAVTSELYYLEGHKKRLNFLYQLDQSVEAERGEFDLFGKQYSGQIFSRFIHYRGELKDKYEGLLPYQYHFSCENSFIPDYFTEKILDPILAECLCFYDGCTNIREYIDERAFIQININDIFNSIHTIVHMIENNEYRKRKKIIVQQKKRILMELNPLNIIWGQLVGKDMTHYLKL